MEQVTRDDGRQHRAGPAGADGEPRARGPDIGGEGLRENAVQTDHARVGTETRDGAHQRQLREICLATAEHANHDGRQHQHQHGERLEAEAQRQHPQHRAARRTADVGPHQDARGR